MKKMMMLSLAAITMGSAYAMPTEGEHSYSMQAPASHVRVVSRTRNIPAPSSWTPPERIPSAPVTYVKRDQPKRVSGGGFSSPSFSTPAFTNPAYTNPGFTNPTFTNPASTSPNFNAPAYSNPSYTTPGTSSPGYSNPGFSGVNYTN